MEGKTSLSHSAHSSLLASLSDHPLGSEMPTLDPKTWISQGDIKGLNKWGIAFLGGNEPSIVDKNH